MNIIHLQYFCIKWKLNHFISFLAAAQNRSKSNGRGIIFRMENSMSFHRISCNSI